MTQAKDHIFNVNLGLDDGLLTFDEIQIGDLFCTENSFNKRVNFLYTKISKAQFKDITSGDIYRANKCTKECRFFKVNFK